MTPLDDDLLTALRAARPDPGYQPSATSPEARAMLARTIQAQHGHPRPARRWWLRAAPGSPPAGRPATRRRRTPVIIIAAAAATAAAATVLALRPGNTTVASPAAAQLLARIATTAAAQPNPPVRDSQFWYIKGWVSYQVCNVKPSSENCVVDKPHERQIWQSVSNLCVTGLLREDGQNTPLVVSGNSLHCPIGAA